MNDNDNQDRIFIGRQFRALNVGANGRWSVGILAAVALWSGYGKIAVVLAMLVAFSVVIEQIPQPWRGVGAMIVYALTAAIAIALLFIA